MNHPSIWCADRRIPSRPNPARRQIARAPSTRLRATPDGKDTPVLVVTAMDLDPIQRQRLKQQAAAVVSKGSLRGNDLIAQVLASLEVSK